MSAPEEGWKFEVGAVVRLLSGGKPMTVDERRKVSGTEGYVTVWHDEQGRHCSELYDARTLRLF